MADYDDIDFDDVDSVFGSQIYENEKTNKEVILNPKIEECFDRLKDLGYRGEDESIYSEYICSTQPEYEDIIKNIQEVDPNFFNNKEFFVIACSNFASLIHKFNPEFIDKESVLSVLKHHSTEYTVNCTYMYLDALPSDFLEDSNFVVEMIKSNDSIYKYLPDEIKNEKLVTLCAVANDGYNLFHAPEKYRDDEEVCLMAAKYTTYVGQFISDRLKDDEEYIKNASAFDPYHTLHYASDRLQNDEEFVKNLIRENYKVIDGVSDKIKDDEEFISEMIKTEPFIYRFASYRLRDNPKLFLQVLENGGTVSCSQRLSDICLSSFDLDDKNVTPLIIERTKELIKLEDRGIEVHSYEDFISKKEKLELTDSLLKDLTPTPKKETNKKMKV